MIIAILVAWFVVQPIGMGVAIFVKEDAKCRKEYKATRLRGAMLEVYCE